MLTSVVERRGIRLPREAAVYDTTRLPVDWPLIRLRTLRNANYRCHVRVATGGLCLSWARHAVPTDGEPIAMCDGHYRAER